MSEAHAVRAVGQGDSQGHDGIEEVLLVRACGSSSEYAAGYVRDAAQDQRGRPSPRARPLSAHRVGHPVEEGTAEEAEGCHERDHAGKYSQGCWPESQQDDVHRVSLAEELCCEGRLVRGVCEGARDWVHGEVSRCCLEVGLRSPVHGEVRVALAPRSGAFEES
eukprot:scaffold50969_cov69-Phaeocystis_antarctica.AAC.2